MWVNVVSLFPEMFSAITEHGITGRAHAQGVWQLSHADPRDFTDDPHRTVDDRPYGGGPGMVMKVAPLRAAIHAAKAEANGPVKVICLSPQGKPLDQAAVAMLAARPRHILVAGRYEGIDERVLEADIDEEWSLGDYVLSGGELAAMVLMDAMVRLLPGALGDADSAAQDSFSAGNAGLLDYPHYTRPEEVDGQRVPEVLLSGDHAAIARWRLQQSLLRTQQRRPDLFGERRLTEEEELLLNTNNK